MNYLIVYLLMGVLFMLPAVLNGADRKKALLFAVFTLPLWPFLFSASIYTLIKSSNYSGRCAFCGERFQATGKAERDQAICDHIQVCEKHPFRTELEGWRTKNRALASKNVSLEMKYLTALERMRTIREILDNHPRAAKLMRKGKYFLVVAHDEPYYPEVYRMIRDHESEKGDWTPDDETAFIKFGRQEEDQATK